jgi:Zn-dependent protease
MNLELAILLLPGLVIGLSFHEFAHAWSASLLGDDFARRQGRVSLNPLRHLSMLGTLAIFLLQMGWGKPVQVNLYNFKHPKRDYLITSLAGPLANIIIVLCCIALAQLTRHDYSYGAAAHRYVSKGHELLLAIAMINTILATLNLLPIPPLDGSKIWPVLIPGLKPSFGAKGTWIFIIAIIFLVRGRHLDPVFEFAFNSTDHYMPAKDSKLYGDYQDAGHLAHDKHQLELAEMFYSEAIAINPAPHGALYWRAGARMRLGKLPEALADIDSAIEIDGDSNYSELRGLILDKLKPPLVTPASQPTSQPANGE